MANSSDSSQAISSGSDSDRPRTPALIAPRKRTNTGLSATAPSKIPKLKPTTTHQSSFSPPRTPANRDTATAALDWGSGGEWSSFVREIKHSTIEMDSKPVDDGALLVDHSVDAHDGGVAESVDDAPLQISMTASGLFSDSGHTTPDLERSSDPIQPKEVSDDDEPRIGLEVDEQEAREEGAGIVLESQSFYATASLTSDSEHSDMLTTSDTERTSDAQQSNEVSEDEELPIVSASSDIDQHNLDQNDLHEIAMPESELSDNEASHSSDSDELPALSSLEGVVEHKSEQIDLHETAMPVSEFSDVGAYLTSDSDVSVIQLPTVRIREPFLNIAMKDHAASHSAGVSPETVLRGLVRDAHPETIHFTLPHSQFSPDDLRKGLQYAYSMLQAATSKSVILELLDDDTTDLSATDLRRWIALVDHSKPQGGPESRMSVVFESLSVGEMKVALEELVQSKLVVEGEAERKRTSLVKRILAKERQEKSTTSLGEKVARCDKEIEDNSTQSQVSDGNETAFDAILTAVMVVLIGALYLCVRD